MLTRGLGAIQPGVNRCKLLADSDFDQLYIDCTTQRWPDLYSSTAEQSLTRHILSQSGSTNRGKPQH